MYTSTTTYHYNEDATIAYTVTETPIRIPYEDYTPALEFIFCVSAFALIAYVFHLFAEFIVWPIIKVLK